MLLGEIWAASVSVQNPNLSCNSQLAMQGKYLFLNVYFMQLDKSNEM